MILKIPLVALTQCRCMPRYQPFAPALICPACVYRLNGESLHVDDTATQNEV